MAGNQILVVTFAFRFIFCFVFQVPLLFDYYYFSVLDMVVHANIISLGLPNWK
jgi:hypothetical protein